MDLKNKNWNNEIVMCLKCKGRLFFLEFSMQFDNQELTRTYEIFKSLN